MQLIKKPDEVNKFIKEFSGFFLNKIDYICQIINYQAIYLEELIEW